MVIVHQIPIAIISIIIYIHCTIHLENIIIIMSNESSNSLSGEKIVVSFTVTNLQIYRLQSMQPLMKG